MSRVKEALHDKWAILGICVTITVIVGALLGACGGSSANQTGVTDNGNAVYEDGMRLSNGTHCIEVGTYHGYYLVCDTGTVVSTP